MYWKEIGNKYPDALEILCWLGILKGALPTASGSHRVTENSYNHYTTLSYNISNKMQKTRLHEHAFATWWSEVNFNYSHINQMQKDCFLYGSMVAITKMSGVTTASLKFSSIVINLRVPWCLVISELHSSGRLCLCKSYVQMMHANSSYSWGKAGKKS